MKLIYIEKGNILPTEVFLKEETLIAILNTDKTKKKTFFNDVILFIFYVYQIYGDEAEGDDVSLLANHPLEDRIITTCSSYLSKKRKASDFFDNTLVLNLINKYLFLNRTPSQKLYDTLLEDMHSYVDYLSNISYEINKKVNVNVGTEEEPVFKDIYIKVPNIDQKKKSYEFSKTLLDYEKELKKIVHSEVKEQRKNQKKSAFFAQIKNIPNNN